LNEAAALSERDIVDNLIRSIVRDEVAGLEPSPKVREMILAKAQRSRPLPSVGESVPALVECLRDDSGPAAAAVSWWELEQCGRERFLLWSYSCHPMNSLDPWLYRDARRCRGVASI
jgi:hypothetical protein